MPTALSKRGQLQWSHADFEARQFHWGEQGKNEISEVRRRVIEIEREKQKKEADELLYKQQSIESEGSVRQALQEAKLEAGKSAITRSMNKWKQEKQIENAQQRMKEDLVMKVKEDATRIKEQQVAERREKQRIHKANRLRTEAQRQAIEDERLAELRRRQAQAAQQLVLPGLGPVSSYSVSYIRQRSKLRRDADSLEVFYDKEEKDLVREAEERYRRVEKKKALTRASKKAKARAEQTRTRRKKRGKGKGRSSKKGGLIGSASAPAIGERAFR
jgi:hypothetical protein